VGQVFLSIKPEAAALQRDFASRLRERRAAFRVFTASAVGFACYMLFATSSAFAASADVGVTKAGPATAQPNTDITYTITYTNNGPDTASNVQMTDTFPTGETFVSFAFLNGATAPPLRAAWAAPLAAPQAPCRVDRSWPRG